MEPWANPLGPVEEVQVSNVARTSDRNAAPWRRQQQLQRWKTHLQRLGQALESGHLGQARCEFEALANDAPELGQADPMAHPHFALLGRSLQSLDLEGARSAYDRLLNECPAFRHRSRPEDYKAVDANTNGAGDTPNPGSLDVIV